LRWGLSNFWPQIKIFLISASQVARITKSRLPVLKEFIIQLEKKKKAAQLQVGKQKECFILRVAWNSIWSGIPTEVEFPLQGAFSSVPTWVW
jgi:hypothetical protein